MHIPGPPPLSPNFSPICLLVRGLYEPKMGNLIVHKILYTNKINQTKDENAYKR